MINIITNNEKLNDELVLVTKLFYTEEEMESKDITFTLEQTFLGKSIHNKVTNSINDKVFENDGEVIDTKFPMRYQKRFAKLCLYDCLQSLFPKVKLPWGSLTGIRPTKLYYELIKENNGDEGKAFNEMLNTFKVSYEKAMMVKEIYFNQQGVIKNEHLVDLYINIPFCPSKCYYCSFISLPIDKCRNLLEPYLDALIKEIEATKELIERKNYIVNTIYIGGGTPTILSAEQLDRLLSHINYKVSEFTVECGRPDTITEDKLIVLKNHEVTRISINPQTFCNKTLKEIGRNHTSKDILEAYKLALKYDFCVNMDFIAGLSSETVPTFKRTINKAIEYAPDNITVHTLSIKRGSDLKANGGNTSIVSDVEKMIEYSTTALKNAGYKPYYLYKQKNMLGKLENIGYFKNTPCLFNINSMEEFASIIACGANAISKRYYSLDNKIERFANLKNIQEYIDRIDEMIEKKDNLFK